MLQFTAEDARKIQMENKHTSLGVVIDLIRSEAKAGNTQLLLMKLNITDETRESLKESGFEVTETTVNW